MTATGSWLVAWPTRMTPLVDLLCCPGAGAGASAFRQWPAALPPFAQVLALQAPGREERLEEPMAQSLSEMAEAAAEALAKRQSGRPIVLFGHSMGGAVAMEIARLLLARNLPIRSIILTASSPPTGHGGGALSREALRALLLAYDPQNSTMIEDERMFAALAPTLAADIALLRAHQPQPAPPLPVDGMLLAGLEDPVVPAASVRKWAKYFETPPEVEELAGGHHFPFQDAAASVAARISAAIKTALRA